ncbi:anaerobic dehydrogenase, typically selenocysteine-containing [Acetobacter orientalis]|uniref:Anaerobic dehydrogenase, typically selenocysteine-containing n=1 Tax=Acetobacter orientalis TaxID=146474 RepID=A0A2Z5ZER0_9PROT|nr:anaerobic dehydrogenase, typically selenocysteine-containing [Acetobacter orientalis]
MFCIEALPSALSHVRSPTHKNGHKNSKIVNIHLILKNNIHSKLADTYYLFTINQTHKH